MTPGSIPIIRLEIEGMRHAILMALTDYAVLMDEQVQAAVANYCTPENITRVVTQAVNQTLDAVLKEEVDNFFRYGKGRKVIKDAVVKKLSKNETYGVMDDD